MLKYNTLFLIKALPDCATRPDMPFTQSTIIPTTKVPKMDITAGIVCFFYLTWS